jgi:hypothetical protein
MPEYRVILKKTKYFPKGSATSSRNLKRYLSKYMDEVEKGKQKNRGENPSILLPPLNPNSQTILPDESDGTFWTGGFLGNTKSPPHYEKNKHKGWIQNTKNTWVQLLNQNPSRRNDGFRFVLSLAPESLKALKENAQSPDQALREIWRQTLWLYRKQHHWDTPDQELGWLAASHHDTNNTHLHILVFPTTQSGLPLRTNNQRGPEKEDDLNNLIALSNIAAEIYWRQTLPLQNQSPQYLQALALNPTEEPPIPTLASFGIKSGLPNPQKKTQKTPPATPPPSTKPAPDWNEALLTPEEKDQSDLETGKKSLLQAIKIQKKGLEEITTLQCTLTTYETWGPKRINPWVTKKNLDGKSGSLKALQEKLPQESKALSTLLAFENLLPPGRAKNTLESLKTQEFGHALLALTTGLKETPSAIETSQGLHKAAALYEKSIQETDSPEKLKTIYQEGLWALQEQKRESLRTQNYKALLKQVQKLETQGQAISNSKTVIQTLIAGSQTLTRALEARAWEAHHATTQNANGTISYQKISRDWSLDPSTNQLTAKPSQGKPWPPHIDPELILPKLELPTPPNPTRTNPKELKKLLSDRMTPDESPLVRFIKSKARRKKKLSQQILKEIQELPEINPPS